MCVCNTAWCKIVCKYSVMSRQVRAILNVENWSRFTLLDSQTDIHCGAVLPRYQATNVYPGYREVMLGVGTEIFGGTCGTISWQVGHSGHYRAICCGDQTCQDVTRPQTGNNDWAFIANIEQFRLRERKDNYCWFSDCGAVSQTHRHVERSLQPQPLRHILGPRHDLQSGDLQLQLQLQPEQ